MALKIQLLSKQALEADIETKRAALKALSEENRAGSDEESALNLAELFQSQGLFNRFGSTLTDAYFKIKNVNCSKDGLTVSAVIFTNEEARQSDAQELNGVNIELPFAESMDKNPIAFAYDMVKQSSLFQNAVDT